MACPQSWPQHDEAEDKGLPGNAMLAIHESVTVSAMLVCCFELKPTTLRRLGA